MIDGPRVFISYRREDCMVHAGRLAENLQARANARVFLDIESIPPGVSFPDFIEREIASCDVVLVMIGDDWLGAADDAGRQRLADTLDWVHLEIVAALERGVLTIPVLVEDTRMPRPDDLPSPLANLALRNAVELRDRSWPQDVNRLIRALPEPASDAHDASPAPTARDGSAAARKAWVTRKANMQRGARSRINRGGATGATSWPARFTDSWFAANVPALDGPGVRALRAELYKRAWSDDEIASRVLVHTEQEPEQPSPPPTPPITQSEPPAFPSRFTDSWFATHVPQMDAATLAELKAVLRTRNWTDEEIADRVYVHAQPGAVLEVAAAHLPSIADRPLVDTTVVTGQVESDDPIGRATLEAAADLAHLALDPTARIRERHLADALARHLPRAVAERKLYVPGWDPQPGNVDVFTLDRLGRADLVIETKLKEGDQVFECLWDMAKALSLATDRNVDAAYLVTGSTVASWNRPVACAELFETGQHNLVRAIAERYRELWIKYILGDSRGRPRAVPDLMDVVLVADVRYPVRGVQWELKAIRVSAAPDARWIPFNGGLPDPR